MNRLFIWSDITGDWIHASSRRESEGEAADAAKVAGTTVLVEKVESLNDLVRLFTRLCQDVDVWHSVSFSTHGSGGQIYLGSTSLNLQTYIRLENQDFGRLFTKDTVITFEGCNVAEGCAGEYFLIQIASTLLLGTGGQVRGSTGLGLGLPTGGTIHPFGTWVTAKLGQGGTLVLENGTHLHLDNINNRISGLRKKTAELEGKGFLKAGDKPELEMAAANAAAWMTTPNWNRRFEACKWLDKAEAKIKARDLEHFTRRKWTD
jgi:hypothetical protein